MQGMRHLEENLYVYAPRIVKIWYLSYKFARKGWNPCAILTKFGMGLQNAKFRIYDISAGVYPLGKIWKLALTD